jgi:hypothetical protein
MKQLKINKNFKPCSVEADDELYPNGIFVLERQAAGHEKLMNHPKVKTSRK